MHPKLPQFPKGTAVALVRRALLIDSDHRVVASPLTESVQLRTITADPPTVADQLAEARTLNAAAQADRVKAWQAFQEFRLERGPLFAGRAGGLHAVGPAERDLKTGFFSHPWDEFEDPLRTGPKFSETTQLLGVRELCLACHSLPGVYSFNSLQDFRAGMSRDGDKLRPYPIREMSPADVAGRVVKWREGGPGWANLRKAFTN